MKFIKLSALFSAAVLLISACGDNANVTPNEATSTASKTPANGAAVNELAGAREIYSKRCINCHRENGEGGEKEFDGVRVKIPNFKDPRVIAEADDEYIEQIERGGHGMPAFKGKITDDEIRNLVRLIRRDFQGK